jgi:signal transduction histidine kinase
LAIIGQERLPTAFIDALGRLNPIYLEPHQAPPKSGLLLVVVNDQAGLGELATHVQSASRSQVVALYTGNRPTIAIRCAQTGVTRVICLDEVAPETLADQISGAADTALNDWPWPILEALPFGVAVRHADGHYQYRNPSHTQVDLEKFISESENGLHTLDLEQLTDPESGRVLLCARIPVNRAPGDQLIEVLEDITGRHTDQGEIMRQRDMLVRRAWDLAQANKELTSLDRAKADFIALAAHEIRTPLTALNTALHLINRLKTEGEREGRFIDMANRNVSRLGALADDLLEFTKLETRQLSLSIVESDASAFLWDSVDAVRAEADAMGVTIDCEISTPLPALYGESDRLGQAIRRLLEHGVRRSPEGGKVSLHVAYVSSWTKVERAGVPIREPKLPLAPEGWVELSVSDRGGSIPMEHLAHLFTGFGSARDPLSTPVDGGGLGLAICRRIAGAHGGVVWAEPVTPDGLLLTLRIPRLSASALGLFQLEKRYQRQCRRLQTPWVLSVIPAAGGNLAEPLGSACQQAGWPRADWVSLENPDEVIALVTGGEEQIREQVTTLLNHLTSSNDGNEPIQIGWASPGDGDDFEEALSRARAAIGPASAAGIGTITGDLI